MSDEDNNMKQTKKGFREKRLSVKSGDTTNAKIRDKGIWKRFFHMCKVARLPYLLLIIYGIAYAVETIVAVKVPQINGNFFAGDASVKSVSMFLGIELLLTVTSQAVLFLNHVIRAKMNRNLQNALWGKILKLKPKYFDKVSASTLISRITVDSESMNEFVMDIVLELVFQIYTLVLTIFEMSKISIKAGLMLLGFLPLSAVVAFFMGRLNMRLENSFKFKMSDLTNYLSELVSCLPLLKAYNMQGYESRRGKQVVNDYFKAQTKVIGFDVFRQVVGAVVGIGPEIVIILMGVKMLKESTVDAAGWYAFYMYAGTFIGFINSLCSIWENNKGTQGRLNKVSDILYEEQESVDGYVNEIIESGDIMFDNVTFGYGDDEIVLDKASFMIPRNKTTAIIGYSGSGKSTILKLLERMYEPDGQILMNGKSIFDTPINKWREEIAFVPQNAPLMSGTIRENITYGIDRDLTDDEIMEVCKQTYLSDFINSLDEGLNYQVGQFGDRLSGGQKQKISVARAVLTNSDILILDEPTASLDIISTDEIIRTIEKINGTRTIIFVTHDAKAVKSADHIIVVDDKHKTIDGDSKKISLMSGFYNELMAEKKEA